MTVIRDDETVKEQNFQYSAFISYNHKDKKSAKWIQKRLESYPLPKDLLAHLDMQVKKLKCFRDEDDLSGTSLQEAIFNELAKSEYLIVVCSTYTPDSIYVNEEVRKFCELRGKEFVIPFIIDGVPESSDKSQECFPSSLLEAYQGSDSPLGYDVRQLGKTKVVSKIAATLLHLSADFLLKRDERKRKQQQYRNCAIGGVITLIILYLISFWIYCHPNKEYYADYIMQKGVPIGIRELTNQELELKESHYCIISEIIPEGFAFWNGTQTYDVRYENVKGTLVEEKTKEDQASWITVTFTSSGQCMMVLRDEHEKEFATYKYSGDMLAMDITSPYADSQALVLIADTTQHSFGINDSTKNYGNISRKYYTYNDKGFVIRVEYMRDNRNTPIADSNGIYGEEYILDDKGRAVETYFLNADGERFVLSSGVYCEKTIYNEEDLYVKTECFSQDGYPRYKDDSKLIVMYDYDENLNCKFKSYMDISGNLKDCEAGYATLGYLYEDGLCVRLQRYNIDGELVQMSDDWAQVDCEYDSTGMRVQEQYLDDENTPCPIWGETATMRKFEYNEKGYITYISFWDNEGNPVATMLGWQSIELEYDEFGDCIRGVYRDESGVLPDDGWDAPIREYQYRDGKLMEEVYYTSDGSFYRKMKYKYDLQTGNIIELRYCGEEDELKPYLEEYSVVQYEYDDNGHVIKVSYLDEKEQLTLDRSGYAYYELGYDSFGNINQLSFYDTKNEPVNVRSLYLDSYDYGEKIESIASTVDLFASVEIDYDENGNPLQKKYYMDENEILYLDDIIVNMSYDKDNNLIEEEYFDHKGTAMGPSLFNDYIRICYEYDQNGILDKQYNYCEDQSYIVLEYDEDGNITKESHFNAKEE